VIFLSSSHIVEEAGDMGQGSSLKRGGFFQTGPRRFCQHQGSCLDGDLFRVIQPVTRVPRQVPHNDPAAAADKGSLAIDSVGVGELRGARLVKVRVREGGRDTPRKSHHFVVDVHPVVLSQVEVVLPLAIRGPCAIRRSRQRLRLRFLLNRGPISKYATGDPGRTIGFDYFF